MEGKERGQVARFVQAASRCNLRRLVLLRNLAIIGLTFAVAMDADGHLAIQMSTGALASVTGFLALFNLATYWRLRRAWPVTDLEVLGHILADIGVFAGLLYFIGGGASCVVGGGLITYIVCTIATLLHEQGRTVAEARRRELAHDYLVRVGSLAAGSAHEIRSSLSTMAVLIKELLYLRSVDREALTQDLRIMSAQIEACRCSLLDLMMGCDGGMQVGKSESVKVFLRDVLDRWEMLRPAVRIACRWRGIQPPPEILTDRSLGQAILNLLDNAVDAAPEEEVEMNCSWNDRELRILIQDRGPGISSSLGDRLGERLLTTKHDKGIGIGLLLAKTAIQRSGGSLKLFNQAGGGACAEVLLPLAGEREEQTAQTMRRHG